MLNEHITRIWFTQTRSTFHETLKINTSTFIQYHRVVFLISRWCYNLSTASSPEVKTPCSILHKHADLKEFSVINKTEIFHVNVIPHDFWHS